MAEFLEKLYISESVRQNEALYRRVIGRGSMLPGLYMITFAENDIDQLAIIPTVNLLHPQNRERLPVIAGLAVGYEAALALVEQIAADAWKATGSLDLRAYLLSIQPPAREKRKGRKKT